MKDAVRRNIRFLLNDEEVVLDDISSSQMLLDFLRSGKRLTGTKEGCNEGDCGACTVLVGRLKNGELQYEGVNACICFLGMLDGTHVVSVEYLSATGALHPIQQAMVDFHASQCGFCTPGIVMSLYALFLNTPSPSKTQIEQALQGNLCRCTGYAPIMRAAGNLADEFDAALDPILKNRDIITNRLNAFKNGARIELGDDTDRIIIPANADDFAGCLMENTNATIVSGATDVGLWVTKDMRAISPTFFVGHLDELNQINNDENGLTLGATVSYSDAWKALCDHHPAFNKLISRIGGAQVRNQGTIGGNIANGSPIGDMPPPLITLNATLTLRRGDERRTIPLEDFFMAYGKQNLLKGEFVESVTIPKVPANSHFAIYKISKRRDEDISALLGAFLVTLENDQVTNARIAFGGMAGIPKRAEIVGYALDDKPWTEDVVRAASQHFKEDFSPLTDWRASREYRLKTANNLLLRFYLETTGNLASPTHEAAE